MYSLRAVTSLQMLKCCVPLFKYIQWFTPKNVEMQMQTATPTAATSLVPPPQGIKVG